MFTETIIAVFILGFLAGCAYAYWTFRPIEKQLAEYELRERRAIRQQLYRASFRREHLGTPYISPPATPVERILVDVSGLDDNDRWSKKAELRSLS